jgi:hypothetical protein
MLTWAPRPGQRVGRKWVFAVNSTLFDALMTCTQMSFEVGDDGSALSPLMRHSPMNRPCPGFPAPDPKSWGRPVDFVSSASVAQTGVWDTGPVPSPGIEPDGPNEGRLAARIIFTLMIVNIDVRRFCPHDAEPRDLPCTMLKASAGLKRDGVPGSTIGVMWGGQISTSPGKLELHQ